MTEVTSATAGLVMRCRRGTGPRRRALDGGCGWEGDLCHLCSPVPLPTVRPTLLSHSKQFAVTESVPDRADIWGPRRSVQLL